MDILARTRRALKKMQNGDQQDLQKVLTWDENMYQEKKNPLW